MLDKKFAFETISKYIPNLSYQKLPVIVNGEKHFKYLLTVYDVTDTQHITKPKHEIYFTLKRSLVTRNVKIDKYNYHFLINVNETYCTIYASNISIETIQDFAYMCNILRIELNFSNNTTRTILDTIHKKELENIIITDSIIYIDDTPAIFMNHEYQRANVTGMGGSKAVEQIFYSILMSNINHLGGEVLNRFRNIIWKMKLEGNDLETLNHLLLVAQNRLDLTKNAHNNEQPTI